MKEIKKATPDQESDLQNNNQNSIRKPVRIPNDLLGEMVNSLPVRAKQGRRTIHKLAIHTDSPTDQVNPFAGVNISDFRQRYNKYIKQFGFEIKFREPDSPILDVDGDISGQKLWGLYQVGGKK